VGRLAIPGRSSPEVKRQGEVRRATESVAVVIPFGITGSWERRCVRGISMSGMFLSWIGRAATL